MVDSAAARGSDVARRLGEVVGSPRAWGVAWALQRRRRWKEAKRAWRRREEAGPWRKKRGLRDMSDRCAVVGKEQ